jgi:poly-gamma-glutamate synthesis protein (capsule biosynthesis protein)
MVALAAIALIVFAAMRFAQPQNRASIKPIHYGTLMSESFYNDAYDAARTTVAPDAVPVGGIIPHHLLAAPLIARFMNGIADQRPRTVILVGPDHLNRGIDPISSSLGTFRTAYGDLMTDPRATDLASDGLLNIDEHPFDYEHSIGGLTAFVKRTFPDAQLLPIILKDSATPEQVDRLASALPTTDTIFLTSVDFSHYLPSPVAQFHDVYSRRIVETQEVGGIARLEGDSPMSLRLAFDYFKRRGAERMQVIDESDSARLTGHPEFAETTSYLIAYATAGAPTTPEPVTTVLDMGNIASVASAEDRFMTGFDRIGTFDGALPKLGDRGHGQGLAAGIVERAHEALVYLFPLVRRGRDWNAMDPVAAAAFFKKNDISATLTVPY